MHLTIGIGFPRSGYGYEFFPSLWHTRKNDVAIAIVVAADLCFGEVPWWKGQRGLIVVAFSGLTAPFSTQG